MKTLSSLLIPENLDDSPSIVGGFRLKANQIAYWCWCLMLFFIPFSTALGLLFSIIAVASGLLGLTLFSLKKAIRQPVIILCLLLYGWLTLSMIWSIAPRGEMLEAWLKYRKLLYPLLVLMVLYNLRKGSIVLVCSFLAGCGVVATGSLLSVSGILGHMLGPPEVAGGWYVGPGWLFIGGPENPTFGRNHITQGAFLSFAAMLALGQAWKSRTAKFSLLPFVLWTLLAIVFLFPIFFLQARTGYLLIFVLCIFWALVLFRFLPSKAGLFYLFMGFLVALIMIWKSPHVLERIWVMIDSAQKYSSTGEMKDSGVRLHFWQSGLKIYSNHLPLGVGLGGYAEAYSMLEERNELLSQNRSQPHSEYILMLTQGGIIGIILILTIAAVCLRDAWARISNDPEFLGFIIMYFSNAAINSAVWDLAEGHVLILATTLVLMKKSNHLQ